MLLSNKNCLLFTYDWATQPANVTVPIESGLFDSWMRCLTLYQGSDTLCIRAVRIKIGYFSCVTSIFSKVPNGHQKISEAVLPICKWYANDTLFLYFVSVLSGFFFLLPLIRLNDFSLVAFSRCFYPLLLWLFVPTSSHGYSSDLSFFPPFLTLTLWTRGGHLGKLPLWLHFILLMPFFRPTFSVPVSMN